MSGDDRSVLLNQLQVQVDQVLEQTGRVFAAINASPKERPVAQIKKLQHVLPVAEHRFHDALDQLENELQLAMLVMRRDLAVFREQSGQQILPTAPPRSDQPVQLQTNNHQAHEEQADAKLAKAPSSELEQAGPDEDDVLMEDAKPAVPEENPEDAKPAQRSPEQSADVKPQPLPSLDSKPMDEDEKPVDANLSIDTKPAATVHQDSKPAEVEQVPDTAIETHNDLDSLFNDDAVSANGLGTDGDDFNFDQADGDIDFGDFGQIGNNDAADNDNIASLLPGLEDYANTQSNEVDLDQLFNLNSNEDNGMNTQGAGEQGNSFEDLLAGFDGETVDDNQTTTGTQDFDFDSLFK